MNRKKSWQEYYYLPQGKFYPVYYLDFVEEPEFGCEGRPENMPVFGRIGAFVKTKQGIREKIISMEEQMLFRSELDEAMWLGYLEKESGERKVVCVRDVNLEAKEMKKEIVQFFF